MLIEHAFEVVLVVTEDVEAIETLRHQAIECVPFRAFLQACATEADILVSRTPTKTALAAGIDKGYPISNFLLVKNHIYQSLLLNNVQKDEIQKISDKGFIFFVISALISYSKSIILGKIDSSSGYNKLRKLIENVINDRNVKKSIKKYEKSSRESYWIPLAIRIGSPKLLKFFCVIRAKQIIKYRKNN